MKKEYVNFTGTVILSIINIILLLILNFNVMSDLKESKVVNEELEEVVSTEENLEATKSDSDHVKDVLFDKKR